MGSERKNGQELGQDNVAKVEGWIAERNQLRDWDDYEMRGRINRSELSERLGFARSVTNQNPEVRKLLERQDKIWFKAEPIKRDAIHEAQEASIERTYGKLQSASRDNNKLHAKLAGLEAENQDNNKLLARVAELEEENQNLRKELDSFKQMQSLIEGGMPGFKI